MEEPPHDMQLGNDEGDYYRGTFSARERQRERTGTSTESEG